ncbi:MAG: 6-phosphogluconolactonase [Candidatus Nanopelagicales bacterium]
MTTPEVLVHRDAATLAAAVAARLVTRVVDAQAAYGHASVCLTGGRIGTASLAALAASPARDAIDWSSIPLWWGDERFVPEGDAERNDTAAREALLDHVPVPAEHEHAMPSLGPGLDVDEAAARYAEELRRASRPEDHGPVPTFDVCLLGIGEDGHVASLFPQQPAVHESERSAVGVHGSPKPPPERVTLTFPALTASREVWILGSGSAKADPVRLALSDAGPMQVPAAGARGRERTLFLLDEDAAASIPTKLRRIASP